MRGDAVPKVSNKMFERELTDETARKLGLERGASVTVRELSREKKFDANAKKWTVTQTTEIELTRFDCWVEVPASKLKEPMVGQDAGSKVTWEKSRVAYYSLDGTKAILCLSPKVGKNSYDASGLTDEMMQAYIEEFGGENILDFEEFAQLKNSAAYTSADKEVG
jgi:hypothetical protein